MNRRSAPERLLLDSNLLLLLAVGLVHPDWIGRYKRTSAFLASDFELLSTLAGQARAIVATPHVLTEVSNLAGHSHGPFRKKVFAVLGKLVNERLQEIDVSARTIADDIVFARLGVTDVAVLLAAKSGRKLEVVTVDLALHLELEARGIPSINFNHYRLL